MSRVQRGPEVDSISGSSLICPLCAPCSRESEATWWEVGAPCSKTERRSGTLFSLQVADLKLACVGAGETLNELKNFEGVTRQGIWLSWACCGDSKWLGEFLLLVFSKCAQLESSKTPGSSHLGAGKSRIYLFLDLSFYWWNIVVHFFLNITVELCKF